MPVFMVEAHYDGENVGGEFGTPNVLRRQEYWTMLSGATGQLYGSEYWNLHTGWQQHLEYGRKRIRLPTFSTYSRRAGGTPWFPTRDICS